MKKRVYIILILLTGFAWVGRAQEGWTSQDSTWLQRVLSGEEPLLLNEETLKAIRAGTLLFPGFSTRDSLLSTGRELPIVDAFDDIASPEARDTFPSHLPPGVYFLYGLTENPSPPTTTSDRYLSVRNTEELKALEKLTPRKSTVDDPTILRYGSHSFYAEDILQTLFRPTHRARKHNAKHANARKTYNQY